MRTLSGPIRIVEVTDQYNGRFQVWLTGDEPSVIYARVAKPLGGTSWVRRWPGRGQYARLTPRLQAVVALALAEPPNTGALPPRDPFARIEP